MRGLALLSGALDYDDYKLRLPYFFGRIFVVVRELKLKERQAMCHQIMPQFAQSAEPVMTKVEESFEEAYRSVRLHFIAKIVQYGRQWIKSDAGVELINKFLTAR